MPDPETACLGALSDENGITRFSIIHLKILGKHVYIIGRCAEVWRGPEF